MSCWPTCGPAASFDSPIRRTTVEGIAMRDKIKLESTAGTGHFYTTTKNKRTMPEKIEIKKFDPVARKHVAYKETKIK